MPLPAIFTPRSNRSSCSRASRSGGLILREIDPYESETDSSKADRDGTEQGEAADCPEDAPVNLSTANGSGLGLGGLNNLSGLGGGSTTSGASGVGGVPGASGSQPDEDRPACQLAPHLLGTTFPTADRKYRADWKRRRVATYDEDEEDPDGDRLFMLSLVPSLRSLRGAAKSALKIELAQLVHKTLYEPEDALADSMTESLAPVVSLAEGSPASSTQSECACGASGSTKCTCACRPRPEPRPGPPLPLPIPLALPLSLPLPRGLRSPKRSRHIGVDFSNFNGHAISKVHGM